jgi:hypothetical protein
MAQAYGPSFSGSRLRLEDHIQGQPYLKNELKAKGLGARLKW